MPTPSSPVSRPRFLVIQLARFGDILQTKRLIQSLTSAGETHCLVDKSLAPLTQMVFPQAVVHGIAAHFQHGPHPFAAMYADLAELERVDFDRILNINFSGLNFALAGMFPDGRVRGYHQRHGQRSMDWWPSLVMRWTRERSRHALNLVDIWGLYADTPVSPELVNPPATPRGGGLGVVMAGQQARRSLPPDLLAPLVHAAYRRIGHGPIFLLGTTAEQRAAARLASLLSGGMRERVRDMTGRTSWTSLLEIVAGLDLVLSPDTGTMHLAAHLGVPVLAFFLSSAWCHETGPYGKGHLVLQALEDCSPCLETAPCPRGVACRRVFSDPALLRLVSGAGNGDARGWCLMESEFDALGVTYRSVFGRDAGLEQRRRFRSMAARMAGIPFPDVVGCDAQHWMHERDWMLPRRRRGWSDG